MLVHISDPHLGREDVAAAQLEAAVETIRALRQVPDAVLVTGDVTEHGTAEEYARARASLRSLSVPVHVLGGNHDDRAQLRAAFGLPGTGDEPVRYVARCGALRVVLCDSTVPGSDLGALDVDWLAAQLDEDPRSPTVVALHHPPLAIGIPVIDAIGLPDDTRAALAALLARSPQVRRVVAGHVHRTAFATLGGCPVLALGSTQMSLRLDLDAQDFDITSEPPLLAVHALVDGELVSHLQPVDPYRP